MAEQRTNQTNTNEMQTRKETQENTEIIQEKHEKRQNTKVRTAKKSNRGLREMLVKDKKTGPDDVEITVKTIGLLIIKSIGIGLIIACAMLYFVGLVADNTKCNYTVKNVYTLETEKNITFMLKEVGQFLPGEWQFLNQGYSVDTTKLDTIRYKHTISCYIEPNWNPKKVNITRNYEQGTKATDLVPEALRQIVA